MKHSLLEILACPYCRGPLGLKVFSMRGKEVEDGILLCVGCKNAFPIIACIPRMLPALMINPQTLKTFLQKHAGKIPDNFMNNGPEDFGKLKKKTSKSFGFQWNVFSTMFGEYEDNFLRYISPLSKTFFRKKLVLDAGCGFGRHTYYAAKYGAEVVGFDLSDAVEAAYRNCGRMPNVHIVQGDIYSLPFRKVFDFTMSIGVIHHLPDPKKGFLSLAGNMKKNSRILVWIYGKEGRTFKTVILEGTIRRATVRMPQKLLYYFCYIPAGVYHFSNGLYNFFSRFKSTTGLAKKLPFKNYARFPFRVKLADAYDFLGTPVNNYYTREDCEEWAAVSGLRDTSVVSLGGRSWKIFGKK